MDDVFDREIVRQKRVDHDGRRARHQRGDQIERPDAAFDQAPRPAPRADDRDHCGIAADDEARKEGNEPSEAMLSACCQTCERYYDPEPPPAASYFDGHFAIT